jgi:hypothetical protein
MPSCNIASRIVLFGLVSDLKDNRDFKAKYFGIQINTVSLVGLR